MGIVNTIQKKCYIKMTESNHANCKKMILPSVRRMWTKGGSVDWSVDRNVGQSACWNAGGNARLDTGTEPD